MNVLSIGGAALLAWTCAVLVGRILLRPAGPLLSRAEFHLFSLLTGMAGFSLLIFAISIAGFANRTAFGLLAAGICAAGLWWGRAGGTREGRLPGNWLFVAIWLVYAIAYLIYALAPEVSSDGGAYHLGLPNRYLREGRLTYVPTNLYAQLSQGLEMVFLFAFAFGAHPAAALQHWIFLAALPWLIYAYGVRFGFPAAGWGAGLLVFASPIIGLDGSSAYNDIAVVAVLFGIHYALRIWEETGESAALALAGGLGGFAYALKYTAFLGLIYVLVCAARWLRRDGRRLGQALALAGAVASVSILPWLLKNWIWVGNPFSPFFNHWFPNAVFDPIMEAEYKRAVSWYSTLRTWRDIPWAVTVDGMALQGLLGPVFLLTPLALAALGHKEGRRLWIPALLFALPYPANIGARFLIPPMPFVALLLGLVLTRVRWLLPGIVILHAIFSWPSLVKLYASPHAWTIPYIPWSYVSGAENPLAYLRHWQYDVWMAEAINRHTRPGEKVYASSQVPEAYCHADLHTAHLSRRCRYLRRLMWLPYLQGQQPTDGFRFWFPDTEVTAVRIREKADVGDGFTMTVAEVRLFRLVEPVPRELLRAVDQQGIPGAYRTVDGLVATRWRGDGDPMRASKLEIELTAPRVLNRLEAQHEPVNDVASVILEGRLRSGEWILLSDTPQKYMPPPLPDLMREGAEALRREGFRYLAIFDRDFFAADYERDYPKWGMELVEETPVGNLYRLRAASSPTVP